MLAGPRRRLEPGPADRCDSAAAGRPGGPGAGPSAATMLGAFVLEAKPNARGMAFVDPDTIMSPGSLDGRAAGWRGAVIQAVRAVVAGRAPGAGLLRRAAARASRAKPGRAMGFCLFSNVAIAARAAQAAGTPQRVAVGGSLDVHHGNGTQAAFAGELRPDAGLRAPGALLYPGTGGDSQDERRSRQHRQPHRGQRRVPGLAACSSRSADGPGGRHLAAPTSS